MAEKRMISRAIIQSKRFLMMSLGAQALYMQLAVQADNDGVVEAFPVMRMCGAQPGDLDNLIRQGFVRWLIEDDVVVVVADFNFMNLLKNFEKYPPGRYIGMLHKTYPDLVRHDKNGQLPLLLQEYSGSDTGVLLEYSINTPPNKDRRGQERTGEDNNTDNTDVVVVGGRGDVDDTLPTELRSLVASLSERYGSDYVAAKVAQLRKQKNIKSPCGWLRTACEQDYHAPSPAGAAPVYADPGCPICHGTGQQTRWIGDTGQSTTYDCDCVRRRKELRR